MARRTPVTVEQPFSRMHSRSRLHHLPAINQSTTPINQSTNQAINQSINQPTNHSQHTTYTLAIPSCLVVLTFVTLLFNPSSGGFPKKNTTVWPPGSFPQICSRPWMIEVGLRHNAVHPATRIILWLEQRIESFMAQQLGAYGCPVGRWKWSDQLLGSMG